MYLAIDLFSNSKKKAEEKLQQEQTHKQDDMIQPKLEQEYWWDMARVTSRDYEMEQLNLRSRTDTFKILFKLAAYLIFFVVILSTAVVSKISFFTMVNAYKVEKQLDMYKVRWGILLCTAISIPYVLSLLSCLHKVLFSSTDSQGSPKILVSLWVLFVELGQTLGLVLLVFKVLPFVENLTGLFIMNAICVIPAVLKLVFSSRRGQNHMEMMFTVVMDIVAILLQVSVWFVFISVDEFDAGVTEQLKESKVLLVNLIMATGLISLGFWENFTQVKYTSNRISFFIQTQIADLRKHNAKIYLVVNAFKVVGTYLFSYFLMNSSQKEHFKQFSTQVNLTENKKLLFDSHEDIFFADFNVYEPMVIHVVATAVCFYTGRTACKLLMQKFGFSLPMTLTTPVTCTVMLLLSVSNGFDSRYELYKGSLGKYFYLDGL